MLIAACFSTFSNETRGNYTIWSPEVGGNGHAYEFVATQAYWGEAALNATTRTPPVGFGYGHLVSISDINENEFVTALLGGASSWTGFTDREIEGEWRWTDGTTLVWQDPDNFQNPVQTAYTNWHGGEPNDSYDIGEDYGIIYGDGTWNDGTGPMWGTMFYVVEYMPYPPTISIDVLAGKLSQTEAGYPSLTSNASFRKSGEGVLLIDQANDLSGPTTIAEGVIALANPGGLSSSRVAVLSGAELRVVGPATATVAGLSLSDGGLVDVTTGGITVASGLTADATKAELLKGRGDSSWNGTSGITSTVAAAEIQAGIVRSVGWKTNSDDSVTVAYAAPGDTNLDGEVNVFDLVNVSGSGTYGRGNPSNWSQGDFDYNGVTNIFDMVQTNGAAVYGRGNYLPLPSLATTAMSVPEPVGYGIALVGLACGGWVALLRRRRGNLRRTKDLKGVLACAYAIAAAATPTSGQSVKYELVTVGDPGNASDPRGYGAVEYGYQIGKYEVTVQQYADFLNAVAKDDPYGLYRTEMGEDLNVAGISRTGEAGEFIYRVLNASAATPHGGTSSGNRPMVYVTWFSAARFANWLTNGQPTGPQGQATTEDGAYTLNGATSGIAPAALPRAAFRLPTLNEWYKAGFFSPEINAGVGGYYYFATQSDSTPGNSIGAQPNQVNWRRADVFSVTQSKEFSASQNYLADVGSYSNSASFYGTFDQSGNVAEWNDLTGAPSEVRGVQGGHWANTTLRFLSSDSVSASTATLNPSSTYDTHGFRLMSPYTDMPITLKVDAGVLTQAQAGYSLLAGEVSVAKSGGGTLVLDLPNSFSGSFVISQGVVRASNSQSIGTAILNVAEGATFAIADEIGRLNSIQVEKLGTIAGTLDVGVGRFTLGSSGVAAQTVTSLLNAGRNGDGTWSGTSGITSTAAEAALQNGIVRSVGWKTNSDDSVTVAYAAPGDTNLDGEVNVFDLVTVSGSGTYGRGNPSNWSQGDFDYNGVTNIFDMVQTNGAGVYGRGNYLPATPPSVNAVPEPASLLLAFTGLASGFYMAGRRGA